jgi:tetratricopeptide (TPR) repeat protein
MSKKYTTGFVYVLLITSIMAGIIYLSGCASTAPNKQTISPERQKAIQDSLQKAYIYQLNKNWSLGYEYYKSKVHRRAIKPFLKLTEIDTIDRFRDVYALLSDCYLQLNIADSAQIFLEKGVEKYPDNIGLLRNLAWIYTEKEMIDEAIELLEQAVELDGKNKDDWKRLADLYLKNQQREESINAFQEVLKIDSADEDAQKALAQLLEDADDRIEMLEQVLANEPENTNVMFQLAEIYERQGEYAKAISRANMYLEKNPEDYIVMEMLGEAYDGKGDYRSAINVFKKIVAAKPNQVKIYTDIASNYKELGDLPTARVWVRKAIAKDRGFGLSYIVLGEIYEVAVDKCMRANNTTTPKFDDKLVYREAYRQYQRAAKDLQYAEEAEKKMSYLRDFRPTKEDYFFNKKRNKGNDTYTLESDCYKWIGSAL